MINPNTQYPGQVEAPDANYPLGGAKNETVPGLFDGTPFEKAMLADIFGLQQGLLNAAGVVASGNSDTVLVSDQMQALIHLVTAGSFMEDSGAADAYVLDPVTNGFGPEAYNDGARFRWIPDNDNTGASTVDINSLGAKDIKTPQGDDPVAGDIAAGLPITIEYDLASDYFIIYSVATGGAKLPGIVQQVNTQDGAVATGTTQMPHDDTIPQNTEGNEYMTLAITPKSATNKLKIEIVMSLSNGSILAWVTAALFQDSVVNALAASMSFAATSDEATNIVFTHYMVAGTTSPITFKVRAGMAVAGTTTFNGVASGRINEGVMASSTTITEVRA